VNLAGVEVILNMADRMEQLQQQLGEMEAEIARLRRLVGEIE
jgi:hypothetical protein